MNAANSPVVSQNIAMTMASTNGSSSQDGSGRCIGR